MGPYFVCGRQLVYIKVQVSGPCAHGLDCRHRRVDTFLPIGMGNFSVQNGPCKAEVLKSMLKDSGSTITHLLHMVFEARP